MGEGNWGTRQLGCAVAMLLWLASVPACEDDESGSTPADVSDARAEAADTADAGGEPDAPADGEDDPDPDAAPDAAAETGNDPDAGDDPVAEDNEEDQQETEDAALEVLPDVIAEDLVDAQADSADTAEEADLSITEDLAMDIADEEILGPFRTFTVVIENTSDALTFETALSDVAIGVIRGTESPFFAEGETASAGLEALAEDGDALLLVDELPPSALVDGAFGGDAPMVEPGEALTFQILVPSAATDAQLFMAAMFAESNDVFVANETGIALFDEGVPAAIELTDELAWWDAGTEVNQAPFMGPDQAPRQDAPNTGAAELGGVRPFSDTTRGLPIASGILVAEADFLGGAAWTFTLNNISGPGNAVRSRIGATFHVIHDTGTFLFEEGVEAAANFELLAEDGDDQTIMEQRDDFEFELKTRFYAPGSNVTATMDADGADLSYNFAGRVDVGNDAFIAFPQEGLRLTDDEGNARPEADVEADMNRLLTVWDAGSEENQGIGVGPTQTLDTDGPDDVLNEIHRYADWTNDFADAGDLIDVAIEVAADPGACSGGDTDEYTVTVSWNEDHAYGGTSPPGETVPPNLSTLLFFVHDGSLALFQAGVPASTGLERYAEDGTIGPIADETSGQRLLYETAEWLEETTEVQVLLEVPCDVENVYLNVLGSLLRTNDAFFALGEGGVRLVEDGTICEGGECDTAPDFNAGAAGLIEVFDAGTELNQAGGAGSDQPGRQAAVNSGQDEGNGLVRELADDGSLRPAADGWTYPGVNDAIRVTITPVID